MDEIVLQFYLDDFRRRISQVRVGLGISTEQICDALDITRQSLSNFENGRGVFKLVNALAISTLFDYVMKKRSILLEDVSDFAIARIDYADFLLSKSVVPQIHSLCYAWQRKEEFYYENKTKKSIFVENIIEDLVLFVDVFSFINEDFYERFLLWMYRISKLKHLGKISVFVDNAVREPRIICKEKYMTSILNAISDVKQRELISLYAMNLHGNSFVQAVQSVMRSRGFDINKGAIVSSNPKTLLEGLPLKAVVLSVDGTPLELSERHDILHNLRRAEEKKEENKLAVLPDKLLDKLFDEYEGD